MIQYKYKLSAHQAILFINMLILGVSQDQDLSDHLGEWMPNINFYSQGKPLFIQGKV